jgi:tripartite-type tricarboxylate transporter receptor subunit TctC
MQRRTFLRFAASVAVLPAAPRHAGAQSFPTRTITLVVPTAAGGAMDLVTRLIAERMREPLGQSVVVENISGANGSIGVGRVARAAADGYTLIVGNWNSHVANGALYTLPYDLLRDFAPIGLIASFPQLIIARASMPADDLAGLIGWLRANPDRATMAIPGVGSIAHISGIFFGDTIGVRFQFVPYRGSAPALEELAAGRVDVMFDAPATSLPQVRAGRIKAYAVMAPTRLAAAPEIPTVDEAGQRGFHFSLWFALWAPKGTPEGVIARLNDALVSTMAQPSLRQKIAEQSMEVPPPPQQTPEALGTFHRAEIQKWWPIIKAAGVRGE